MHMRVLLIVLPLLAGCTLIDQRTFMRAPPAPGAAEMARPALAARPYIVLTLPLEGEDWARQVADALAEARARRPDAAFDVLAAVPLAGDDAAAARGGADARRVADALGRAGVPPELLHVGLQGDAGTPGREVRIFIR